MYDELILFLASFLVWLMFAGLVILWFIDGKIKKEQVLHALFSSFVAFTISEILKQIFHTIRPFQIDGFKVMTLTTPNGYSFPSEHSAVAFALALTVWLHDKKVGTVFIILAVLVGAARVLANVHFPIDIIGGGLIGILSAISVGKLHLRG